MAQGYNPKRPIYTTYYTDNHRAIRVNHAAHANSAVLRCIDHMQLNHYGASVAEVFDAYSGALHAVIRHSAAGRITIVFKREVKEGM